MQSISNILIANRGEIARRIIRTAHKMGISTLAIFTEDEEKQLHVTEATQARSLGSGPLSQTYLNIPLIIKIALENNCDAIHPGYGFLSENADFAEACKKAGIIFIGPDAESIRLMGNKTAARKFVENIHIPLPFSVSDESYSKVRKKVQNLIFPLIVKAAAGGGGKGMKIVYSPDELSDAWESAGREALAYFGNSTVYLEQYIEDARHIEVQVLADTFGNVVHLYDRECSIQRRYQKIIEEAPSPTLTQPVREKLLQTAVGIAKAMNYTSAGTLEFLVDKDLNFYFLEMNTRIQVEHPVTEAITGIDIVEEQINIARGKSLSFTQDDIKAKGHAVECRVYAEDAFSGFLPSPGKMTLNYFPKKSNIRTDSAFDGPANVSSDFDPLIAKVVAHAQTRNESIQQLHSYLKTCGIHGIQSNLEYLTAILEDSDYQQNNISTNYCDHKKQELYKSNSKKKTLVAPQNIIASALAYYFKPNDSLDNTVWGKLGSWRNIAPMNFAVNGENYSIHYQVIGLGKIYFTLGTYSYLISGIENQDAAILFHLNGSGVTCLVSDDGNRTLHVTLEGLSFEIIRSDRPDLSIFNRKNTSNQNFAGDIISPLNGKVIQLNVKQGDKVSKGETLMIVESMKMENKILAPSEAIVSEVKVTSGEQVIGNELLIKLTMLN